MKTFLKALVSPQIPEDIGSVLIEWTFPEYIQRKRGKTWYIVVGVLVGLALVYAIWTMNILFAVILVLGVFIIVFQTYQPARQVPVIIGEDGVILDKTYYPYKVLKSFWIIYEPPEVKYLYLNFKTSVRNNMPIPLSDVNPIKVREMLLNYISENYEKDVEDFNETFSRMINIH